MGACWFCTDVVNGDSVLSYLLSGSVMGGVSQLIPFYPFLSFVCPINHNNESCQAELALQTSEFAILPELVSL